MLKLILLHISPYVETGGIFSGYKYVTLKLIFGRSCRIFF